MKFRNILLTTFAASAFVIGTTSCSDSFLDEKMYSSYGPEVSDVNAKLVGLHRQYAAIWGMSSQQGFVGCWQVGTDVGAPGDNSRSHVLSCLCIQYVGDIMGRCTFGDRIY